MDTSHLHPYPPDYLQSITADERRDAAVEAGRDLHKVSGKIKSGDRYVLFLKCKLRKYQFLVLFINVYIPITRLINISHIPTVCEDAVLNPGVVDGTGENVISGNFCYMLAIAAREAAVTRILFLDSVVGK
ncbi:hypothetical protein STEG23_018346, partial [Scotinomys teguina]